ncbi:MAG: hypothetical protein LBV68_08455 [Spirochaetaceae bacterium]|jgi:hypothetical protein|nr:hypothetical protein [Spirochaetaceae bacterium]
MFKQTKALVVFAVIARMTVGCTKRAEPPQVVAEENLLDNDMTPATELAAFSTDESELIVEGLAEEKKSPKVYTTVNGPCRRNSRAP